MRKSKVFFWLLVSFIFGIAVSSFVFFQLSLVYIFFIGGIFLLAIFPRGSLFFWLGLFVIIFNLGIIRYQNKTQNLNISFDKQEAVFEGVVKKRPSVRLNNTQLIMGELSFQQPKISVNKDFKILVFAHHYPEYQYGDKLLVEARLSRPQKLEEFDYQAYLAKDDIYLLGFNPSIYRVSTNQGNILKGWLFQIRAHFEKAINIAVKEPQASFLSGLLLGAQERMDIEVLDNFRKVGLTHIVALSGYNITIIASFLIFIFTALAFSRSQSFWLVTAVITGFVMLTGGEASVVRAAIMGMLILLANKVGRIYDVRNALVLAAAIMLWFNPKLLIFDVGFELSFLATLGLVYLTPRLNKLFQKIPNTLELRNYLSTTLGAQFAVLPLLLYRFETFSLVAPLANILVLPTIPLIMLIGFLAGVGQLIFSILGSGFGFLSWILLSWPIMISEKLASWPLASVGIKLSLIFVLAYGGLLWMWLKLKPQDEY